jgi:hypothetical protein
MKFYVQKRGNNAKLHCGAIHIDGMDFLLYLLCLVLLDFLF